MAAVRHHLRSTRRSEFRRYGVLDRYPIYDVVICGYVHCLLPMAYEQRTRVYHVFTLLRVCGRITDVRV